MAKQPGLFSALLSALVGRFPCYAIVRNPWRCWPPGAAWTITCARGAELYNEGLKRELASIEGGVGRQLRLPSWWHDRLGVLPQECCIVLRSRWYQVERQLQSGGRSNGTDPRPSEPQSDDICF